MKAINSRAAQFISGGAGFLAGKLVSAGFLDKITGNETLVEFLGAIGFIPTQSSIELLFVGLFWALYNAGMTLAYGAKFKEIQQAHGLVPDRWAGPKTMAAALETKGDA